MLTSDNIFSNVIQRTQADRALTEVAEEIFREHTTTQSQQPNQERKELRGTNKDGTTTPTDKVVPFGELNDLQNSFSRKNFSWFRVSRRVLRNKKKILNISLTNNSVERAINLTASNSASRKTKSAQSSKMKKSLEP